MDLAATLFALGTIPYFTSRLFAPVFWLSMWAALQESGSIEYLATNLGLFEARFTLDYPDWFVQPGVIFILFVLTVIESLAEKNPDAAHFMALFDSHAKGFGSFAFNNGVTISSSFAMTASLTATYGVYQAGFGFDMVWAAVVGSGVWIFAKVRGALVGFFLESDEDDDLGIRKLVSWAEDAWVGMGTFLLVLLPILALVVSGLTLLVLFLVQRHLKAREEKQKVACAQCGQPNYPAALECFSCRHPTAAPVKLGFFGQPSRLPVTNADEHRLELLSRKRCYVCAARLRQKSVRQNCTACGSKVFESMEWVDSYLTHVKSKLPKTLLVSLGLSLVPLVGLVPGIIYYRLSLISNLKGYIPRSTGCMLRWVVRLVNMLLLALQWVPILGAVTLPLMCLVNYFIYLRSIENEKLAKFAPRHAGYPSTVPVPGGANA